MFFLTKKEADTHVRPILLREVQKEDRDEGPSEGDNQEWQTSFEGPLFSLRHYGLYHSRC
jgi:hypothetical protein